MRRGGPACLLRAQKAAISLEFAERLSIYWVALVCVEILASHSGDVHF
jgi:hypothetical protein